MQFPSWVTTFAWSPCSRSIAISRGGCPATVEILDAATLVRLTTPELPTDDLCPANGLVFSPDGRLLTWYGYEKGESDRGKLISWDLQTGGLVSAISAEEISSNCVPITYSACGTMFGVLFCGSGDATINTYNALSGTHICSRLVKFRVSGEIWTHGECLRFATVTPGHITTWEAGFASTHALTEVETLSIPGGCHDPTFLLVHPTLPRLAFVCEGRVRVWDTQDSKFLLDPVHVVRVRWMSFSPDGRFFACNSTTSEGKTTGIYL